MNHPDRQPAQFDRYEEIRRALDEILRLQQEGRISGLGTQQESLLDAINDFRVAVARGRFEPVLSPMRPLRSGSDIFQALEDLEIGYPEHGEAIEPGAMALAEVVLIAADKIVSANLAVEICGFAAGHA